VKAALLPAGAPVAALGELPAGLDLVELPVAGPLPAGLDRVGFLVFALPVGRRLADLVPRLTALEVVQSLYAGVDPLRPLARDGVTLCNAAGVHDGPVAEWIVAVTLALRRRLPDFDDRRRAHRWDDANLAMAEGRAPAIGSLPDLRGARVLIVGHGSIGRATQRLLEPFGALVTGVARRPRPGVHPVDDLPELVPQADVVVLLAPHTPDSERLVDAAFLAALRPGAVLVNAARGALVDTGALVAALREGRIRAALDVTDPEPLPPDHPLWDAPGLLLTPHVAGSVDGWEERAYRLVGDQLRRWVGGEPLVNVRSVDG
jgi:phosphoglycerate dehydrogenase-like enzyme